jgi:hypothetical protein
MVTDPLSEAVPNELRDFADRSVEQAKKAFDGFIGVVNAAIAGQEPRPAEPTATAAAHLSRLAVGFAERNVQGAFEFAHNMVHAADLAELLKLQRQFLETQMKALKSQMRSLDEADAASGRAQGRRTASQMRRAAAPRS